MDELAWYTGLVMHALLRSNPAWDMNRLAKIAVDYAKALIKATHEVRMSQSEEKWE